MEKQTMLMKLIVAVESWRQVWGEGATSFAVVVQEEDEDAVLEHDDGGEAPQDDAGGAQDLLLIGREAGEDGGHGVEGRRADVA